LRNSVRVLIPSSLAVLFLVEPRQESIHQQWDVLFPLPECGQVDVDDLQLPAAITRRNERRLTPCAATPLGPVG
jgi:hypothetical protein